MRLQGSDIVERVFGCWPSFHDAEVLRITLNRDGPSLSLELLTFALDKSDGRLQHFIVRLEFHGIDELRLEGFNHQNAIWGLSLADAPNERIDVHIESTFGASCSFTCARGVVGGVDATDLKAGQPF
jgi:hypothetical protein